MNLRGGSKFAEDVSLKAAAQLEHKHADVCLCIFLLQSQSRQVHMAAAAVVHLGELFPFFGLDAALHPVIETFYGARWLQLKVSAKVSAGSACTSGVAGAAALQRCHPAPHQFHSE